MATVLKCPAQAQQRMFKGDREGMLDLLIAASQVPAVSHKACPALFGRELQPWQDSGLPMSSTVLDEPLERHSRTRHPQKRSKRVSHTNTFACPALLAVSPKPGNIPMPTVGLMSKCRSPIRTADSCAPAALRQAA